MVVLCTKYLSSTRRSRSRLGLAWGWARRPVPVTPCGGQVAVRITIN